MPQKQFIDRSLFGWKPVHKVNGIPWPRINGETADQSSNEVPLKQEYLLRSMDYLDTEEAKGIFEAIGNHIISENMTGIIDVGCRIGRINDVLQEKNYGNYSYMGFDTSTQPIEFAKLTWAEFDNIDYRQASWDDVAKIKVDFRVDCVIWSGVLLYRPNDHMELFHRLSVDFYRAKWAIIQEPLADQIHWLPNLKLNTIADHLHLYRDKYKSYEETIVEAPIFSGRRKIVKLRL
jgi:SAM-dependent methyltransferase